MKYTSKNQPLVCMMRQSTCYKNTTKMNVKGVLWHSTGANNPNLKRYVQPDDDEVNRATLIKKIGVNAYKNDWNHVSRQAGVNAFIGKLADGTVTTLQTLPWNYKPWGCGSGTKGSCNNGWIQFEICEDSLKDKAYFEEVYEEACQLTAYLCQLYKLDPMGSTTLNGVKVPVILDHRESHTLKLGSNHGDVYYWLNKYGKSLVTIRKRVKEIMSSGSTSTAPTTTTPSTSTSTIFEPGDVVAITGKTYYSGKTIPSWVLKKNWIVSSTPRGSSRIVLGKSEDGKDSIDSAFNKANLKLIRRPTAISVGDLVKIIGKTYYSGKTVPTWALKENWYVLSINGDKVVLGQNEKRNNSLNSVFNKADLQKI